MPTCTCVPISDTNPCAPFLHHTSYRYTAIRQLLAKMPMCSCSQLPRVPLHPDIQVWYGSLELPRQPPPRLQQAKRCN